jgi:phage terminase large subunit GpA-like protein
VRNEAFDCWKYAIAGFRLAKIDPARRAEAAARGGAGVTAAGDAGNRLSNWKRA